MTWKDCTSYVTRRHRHNFLSLQLVSKRFRRLVVDVFYKDLHISEANLNMQQRSLLQSNMPNGICSLADLMRRHDSHKPKSINLFLGCQWHARAITDILISAAPGLRELSVNGAPLAMKWSAQSGKFHLMSGRAVYLVHGLVGDIVRRVGNTLESLSLRLNYRNTTYEGQSDWLFLPPSASATRGTNKLVKLSHLRKLRIQYHVLFGTHFEAHVDHAADKLPRSLESIEIECSLNDILPLQECRMRRTLALFIKQLQDRGNFPALQTITTRDNYSRHGWTYRNSETVKDWP